MSKIVQDFLNSNNAPANATETVPTEPAAKVVNPLANLTALSDDDDEGLIELEERASDAMALVVEIIDKLAEATADLGARFDERTIELNGLVAGGAKRDDKAVKRVSNSAASDLEVYVSRLSVEIPEFHKQHSDAMDAFGKIAMISGMELHEDPKNIRAALTQVQIYRNGISTSSNTLVGFRETIAGLPRMTTAFGRARKRAVAVTDDLLAQLRAAARQIEDVEGLLKRILDSPEDSPI